MPPALISVSRSPRAGLLFALASALCFGGLTTLASLYYRDGGNFLSMLLFRFTFAALALFLFFGARVRPPSNRRDRVGMLVVGVAWSFGVIAYLAAVHYIEVGIAALILYTFPVIVMILSLLARELRSTLTLWLVFLTAFAGLALMLVPSIGTFSYLGLLLAFAAAMLFAVTFFIGARVSPIVDAPAMAMSVTLVGLVLIVPMVYWSGEVALPHSGYGWLFLVAALVLYLGGMLTQFHALARARAPQVSMVMNLEPMVTVALGIFILGEHLTRLQWIGASAVIGTLLVAQRVMKTSAVADESGAASELNRR